MVLGVPKSFRVRRVLSVLSCVLSSLGVERRFSLGVDCLSFEGESCFVLRGDGCFTPEAGCFTPERDSFALGTDCLASEGNNCLASEHFSFRERTSLE